MSIVTTIYGDMDEALLVKRVGPGFVEYYLKDELVHRSASVDLEQRFPMLGSAQLFAGDHVPEDGVKFTKYGIEWEMKR